jgi:hypothetical protein
LKKRGDIFQGGIKKYGMYDAVINKQEKCLALLQINNIKTLQGATLWKP